MDWTGSSNGGGDDWLSAVVKVGTALYGANQAQKANKQAAETVQQGTQQAAGAIAAGNQAASERLARLEAQGQPGVDYLRGVVARDPNQLTEQDQQVVENARRVAANQLATTGLRGSGRAVTASLRRVNEGTTGQIIEGNRARQNNGATALANMSTGATTGIAGIDQSGGRSTGSLLQDTANTTAGSQIASGNIANSTLGAISGIFAADERDRQRERRYGKQYGGVSE